jgi:hypothetical protein
LFEASDAVGGEGWYAFLTDAVDPQAAVFGLHIDLEVPQRFRILSEPHAR